jgi:hypothetical protein
MHYLYNEYGVTNKRLLLKKGVICITVTDIPIDRIESIYCVQGFLGRMLHYGTIYVTGTGGTKPAFYMVCRPFALRRKIAEIIEKNKVITMVQGRQLPRVHTSGGKQSASEEPLSRYGTFVRVLPRPRKN